GERLQAMESQLALESAARRGLEERLGFYEQAWARLNTVPLPPVQPPSVGPVQLVYSGPRDEQPMSQPPSRGARRGGRGRRAAGVPNQATSTFDSELELFRKGLPGA